jgi:hypothetical protein
VSWGAPPGDGQLSPGLPVHYASAREVRGRAMVMLVVIPSPFPSNSCNDGVITSWRYRRTVCSQTLRQGPTNRRFPGGAWQTAPDIFRRLVVTAQAARRNQTVPADRSNADHGGCASCPDPKHEGNVRSMPAQLMRNALSAFYPEIERDLSMCNCSRLKAGWGRNRIAPGRPVI